MGGFPAGGGVCVSCLLGVNGGLVVLLLLLSGFFLFLFLIRVVGAMVAWLEQVGCRVREFFTPAVRLGKSPYTWGFGDRFVQECLRGRFLPLQVRQRVGSGATVCCVLFLVPWSESKKFLTLWY